MPFWDECKSSNGSPTRPRHDRSRSVQRCCLKFTGSGGQLWRCSELPGTVDPNLTQIRKRVLDYFLIAVTRQRGDYSPVLDLLTVEEHISQRL
jgi:hypothetical protein